MTLEEKFAEMFPEYVAGSELLSPYWDLFEAGAEVTEQKMRCCLNCNFWKDKKYNVCREIKKLGKTCCTFWELEEK